MNRGIQETRRAFEAEGLSQNAAADAVQCDSGNFSKIMRDDRKPGRELAARIFKRFGTPLEAWDEAPTELLPVVLDEVTPAEAPAPKRQSSAPPPPAPVLPDPQFQAKSRAWFNRVDLVDATEADDETTARDLAVDGVRFSERDRTPTEPDPRAGDTLDPTPKPLTVLDVVVPERIVELDEEEHTPIPGAE